MHNFRPRLERAAPAGADVPRRDAGQHPARRQRCARSGSSQPEKHAALHVADAVADVRTILHRTRRAARVRFPRLVRQSAAGFQSGVWSCESVLLGEAIALCNESCVDIRAALMRVGGERRFVGIELA